MLYIWYSTHRSHEFNKCEYRIVWTWGESKSFAHLKFSGAAPLWVFFYELLGSHLDKYFDPGPFEDFSEHPKLGSMSGVRRLPSSLDTSVSLKISGSVWIRPGQIAESWFVFRRIAIIHFAIGKVALKVAHCACCHSLGRQTHRWVPTRSHTAPNVWFRILKRQSDAIGMMILSHWHIVLRKPKRVYRSSTFSACR